MHYTVKNIDTSSFMQDSLKNENVVPSFFLAQNLFEGYNLLLEYLTGCLTNKKLMLFIPSSKT